MPDSDITVTALSITPGIGHNLAKLSYTDPNAIGLDSLKLDAIELWAASSNDRTLASKVDEGRDKAAHMGVVEGSTYYYWAKVRNKSGFYGDWYPSGSTSGVIGTVGFAAGAAQALINGKITATAAANAITIRVKTLSGDDPSSVNPVYVGFRSVDGSYVVRAITAALSLVISSGSTLGVPHNRCPRIWIVAFDDAATVRLAAVNCSADGAILPLSEIGTASATAEGGAGAADTIGTFYASVAISAKQFRVVAFLEWTSPIAPAGQYVTPNVIHLVGPTTKMPGDMVQYRTGAGSAYTSGVNDIPYDDTGPLISEGSLGCDIDMVPTSPANSVILEFVAYASRSNAGPIIASAIEASALDTQISGVAVMGAADEIATVTGKVSSFLNSVTARNYQLRIGATGGATLYVNGISSGRKLGQSMFSFISATEIMG